MPRLSENMQNTEKVLLPESALNFQSERTDGGDATLQESNDMDSCALYHSYGKGCDVSCGLLIQFYYSKEIKSANSTRKE